MTKKRFDVVATIGTYTDKDGREKRKYQRCGVVFENERGLSLKLEAIPVGGEWNGWLMLMEPRESQGGGGGYNAPAAKEQTRDEPPFDDDVPFATSAGIW